MATTLMYSLHTGKKIQVSRQNVVHQMERAEKKNFSRSEAFKFDSELKKRNTIFIAILDDTNISTPECPALAAYAVFVHFKPGNVVNLHKICVLEDFRRQGVATQLLTVQVERLKKQGCSKIQLWVDESNVPARSLYKNLGLEDVKKVQDYYAPWRTGIHMVLDLEWP